MDSDIYPHRGFMLDTGRKFFPVQAIINLLILLHQYNFNVFHWHIYDAESFPLYWPADGVLTEVSLKYSHTRQYYTPEDIRYIVTYAEGLGIEVYPETDMPGHSDIWGYWKPDLIVGNPDLKHPNAQLDIRNPMIYDYIVDLVSTVDKYFLSKALHHFGGDEVALIWHTEDDSNLLTTFFKWLKTVCCPSKTLIMWDDPATDEGDNGNGLNDISTDWVVQTWHNGVTQRVLDKGHRVIVSESNSFYIGNADYDKVSSFVFPVHPNVLGFEIVWFTSENDDPDDLDQNWIIEPLRAASRIRRKPS
ncbi:beta-hexosaminidase, putative [Talaromyces stipitatus ATCC 10500]|uniref:beta-N-acetylhexosaminidase n=1 Tax=Talaromyces stipitatus (strain ATCC 10500 / CBS 375.48 / QM 6759 / NRRL 1006) TaxID=441959 RepID=B8LXE5_TALSN|nr:beta-hexosaminidase, putative [Talaromyces stipitatus ATCC 10500]EED23226.1 beta-hexosaminidase, putative [Talaromyces stipitatus ATCC 10500]